MDWMFKSLSSCAEEHKQYFYGDIDFTTYLEKVCLKKVQERKQKEFLKFKLQY